MVGSRLRSTMRFHVLSNYDKQWMMTFIDPMRMRDSSCLMPHKTVKLKEEQTKETMKPEADHV